MSYDCLEFAHYLAYNYYLIGQHRGIPLQLAHQNNRTAALTPSLIPDVASAVTLYRSSGGHLSNIMTSFGVDPLRESPAVIYQRQMLMEQNLPSSEELFGFTVNGVTQPFEDSLLYMIDISIDLQRFILSFNPDLH